MYVVSPKVTTKVECVLNGEVLEILASECYDFLLCNEQSKLIFAFVGQLAQLHSSHFGANVRCQIRNFSTLQKVRKGGIGALAMLVVLERL
jgi:hypothetical protein